MPRTLAWRRASLDRACQSGNMAILLTSLLFVIEILYLPKYRVNYYDYIILAGYPASLGRKGVRKGGEGGREGRRGGWERGEGGMGRREGGREGGEGREGLEGGEGGTGGEGGGGREGREGVGGEGGRRGWEAKEGAREGGARAKSPIRPPTLRNITSSNVER